MPSPYSPPKNTNLYNQNISYQTKVALIGDSITELTKYPRWAAEILGTNYTVGNFGVCGTTVSLDSCSPYMHTDGFVAVKKFQPQIAVIMLGTNDSDSSSNIAFSNFVDDYLTLIKQLQVLPCKPGLYLVKPPPIFSSWGGLSGEVLLKEIIPAIEQTARKASLPIIDIFSELSNPIYFPDGVHPNEAGSKVIADVICQTLTMNLNS
jgi:lysophospholipase L1-like esterase